MTELELLQEELEIATLEKNSVAISTIEQEITNLLTNS